ncbi:aldo/keto reductase [Litorilinea aerophila]|uniref:Aldo/keto reductase n=1 Tax=Litorilinea aerophila TaxID=1204385 RepID=A0A540VCP3_9CHLR|nr:aldo/keto reductase [Litorilinea aerophila]MCC9077739.1 aldo/keto reductase [Litorilinea aerophila]GIV76975.1 MAG: aldo/keto reductase [Litorilinea sp.]
MNYVLLGRTGVKVSELCFGTMSFGATADEAESKRMFQRCLDAGINFFDCANVYAGGRSEEILGDLIQGIRDELVITSKVFGRVGKDVNAGGLSRRHITRAVEDSLRRLKTDRLDLYFVHQFDRNTPIEEVVRALDDLVQAGKIVYPAVSNWAAWQIMKALGISYREGLARFECIQPMYNLVKRQVEVEILPLAQEEQLGVIPYSPLGGGLLTGKYTTKERPAQGRLVENDMYMKRYGVDFYYEVAEKFSEHARARGVHPATLAVAWVLHHPAVTAPIIGARNVEQLEASLAAVEVEMTDEWWQEISNLSYTPPPATDRLEEQRR